MALEEIMMSMMMMLKCTHNECMTKTLILSGAARNSCVLFHMEAAHTRFYLSSVWKNEHSSNIDNEEDDVTLITHMSINRLNTFNYLVKHWTGPIAVSIYGSYQELMNLTNSLRRYPNILDRNNININIMVKSGVCSTLFLCFFWIGCSGYTVRNKTEFSRTV